MDGVTGKTLSYPPFEKGAQCTFDVLGELTYVTQLGTFSELSGQEERCGRCWAVQLTTLGMYLLLENYPPPLSVSLGQGNQVDLGKENACQQPKTKKKWINFHCKIHQIQIRLLVYSENN